jgi:hypothetical protein
MTLEEFDILKDYLIYEAAEDNPGDDPRKNFNKRYLMKESIQVLSEEGPKVFYENTLRTFITDQRFFKQNMYRIYKLDYVKNVKLVNYQIG